MRVVNANIFSKFFKAAVLVVSLSGAYAATMAAPSPYVVVNKEPGFGNAKITHIGSDSQSLLVELSFENNTGERVAVIVKDENSHTLYRGWFNEKDFSKKFRLPKTESEKLTVIIRSESGKASEAFEINSNRRVIEDVVVKKVM